MAGCGAVTVVKFSVDSRGSRARHLSGCTAHVLRHRGLGPRGDVLDMVSRTYSSYIGVGCRMAGLYQKYTTHPYCAGYPGSTVDCSHRKGTIVSRSGYVDYNGYRRTYPCRTVICVPIPYRRTYPMGTVSGSRCNVRRVSPSGYVCYKGYLGTYPFNTVFSGYTIFSMLGHVGTNGRMITVITPTMLTRFGRPIRRIFKTLGTVNFASIVRMTCNTRRAVHHRARRFGRGLRRNTTFVAADYYSTCMRLTGGRVPRLLPCVSSANSPVCCITRCTGGGRPRTRAMFVTPYTSGGTRKHSGPGISFI